MSVNWILSAESFNIEIRPPLCYSHLMNILQRDVISSNNRISAFKSTIIIAALFFIFFIAPGIASAETKEKIQLGAVENVVLLPWGVTLPARIDTGAALSSLDARNLIIRGNTAEFSLPEKYGGQQIRLPIVKWKTVKSAEMKEKRPVVVVELCIGSKRIRTEVNLNDRSNVKHPLLIGRNTLALDFIVACDESYCAKPSCPEVTSK
jgi:hypothetical protein